MPVRSSSLNVHVRTYCSPSQFSKSDWGTLRNDMRSNILLPNADKVLYSERHGQPTPADQFWIAVYTSHVTAPNRPSLDFLAACADGPLGKYPLFIHAVRRVDELDDDYLNLRMRLIVEEVVRVVPTERIYSIFALKRVKDAFVRLYQDLTGVAAISKPYYSALFTYCTQTTLRREALPPVSHGVSLSIRQAGPADIPQAANLCYGFAYESPPFVHSEASAYREATILQQAGQLFVLEVAQHGVRPSVASIVAVTRADSETAAITKVYTSSNYRGKKLAERIVRWVCELLLDGKGVQRVVLYVAHDNQPAAKVYHRVGFVGIFGDKLAYVEDWEETGFDRRVVKLGFW